MNLANRLTTEKLDSVVDTFAERIDRELRAAWRADYEYVHVYTTLTHAPTDTPAPNIRLLPSESAARPDPADLRYVYSYDLSSVDAERVRELANT